MSPNLGTGEELNKEYLFDFLVSVDHGYEASSHGQHSVGSRVTFYVLVDVKVFQCPTNPY